MTTIENISARINAMGGELFLVGGAVRDKIMGEIPHDHDFVVVGISESDFDSEFGHPARTGKLFPVFRMKAVVDGVEEGIELALARKEEKVSEGHNGFSMVFSKDITIEEDLIRRDVTMNAMAISMADGRLVDPFGGKADIEAGIIRATSKHFSEDPLRVLRVARQAAKFSFSVSSDTQELMFSCKGELSTLPFARIWVEMEKALGTKRPSAFFEVLRAAKVLDAVLPEMDDNIFGCTMRVLDTVSAETDSLEARFAAVFHAVGADVIEQFDSQRFPAALRKAALAVSRNFEKAAAAGIVPGDILDILVDIRRSGCSLSTMRSIVRAAGGQTDFLQDDFAGAVMSRVPIPDDIATCGDGCRIADFVRQARIDRIRRIS